jgi:cytochrome c oxidase assembly factor CtaG
VNLPLAHVSGSFAPLELIPPTIAAVLYWARATTLRQQGRPVPVWRQACFAGGLAVIPLALFSPVGHIAEELVIAHMIEHLLIADVAAILIVLGLTGPVLQPVLALPVIGRLRFLAHPAIALPLWAANLFFWHIPAIYDAAYAGAPIHALEHTMFLICGTLMWMPLLGPLPMPEWFGNGWRLGYVLAVRFTGAILGNILMWSGTVLYDSYRAGEAYWGISPLTDQSTAGAIMMVEGTFIALGTFAYLFFRTANQGIERQRLLDLARSRGIQLDERRAARAVASGHAALLEERLLAGSGGGAGERREP